MKSPVIRLLLPLAWLYGLVVRLRGAAYDRGWLRSRAFGLPVICVGNLAVGGTGKTPHTEYLIRLLRAAGLRVATLSRGYRRHTRGFLLATTASTAAQVGDEPAQMKGKYPNVTVAVCEDRCEGIRRLMDAGKAPDASEAPDVILLDDAYQHRRVRPGLSILLTDYHRPFYDDALLPAGRLREPWRHGKERADLVVVTKCPPDLTADDCAALARRLALRGDQRLYFSTLLYGALRPVFPQAANPRTDRPTPQQDEAVLVVTGIAQPAPLLEEVRRHTTHVQALAFADHHDFSDRDLRTIGEAFDRLLPLNAGTTATSNSPTTATNEMTATNAPTATTAMTTTAMTATTATATTKTAMTATTATATTTAITASPVAQKATDALTTPQSASTAHWDPSVDYPSPQAAETPTAPQNASAAPQGTSAAPQGTSTAPQRTSTAPQRTSTAPLPTPPCRRIILTTEKDAVRLRHHPHFPDRLKPHLYALPVEVSFLFDEQQSFNQNIIAYVSTHTRDRRLPPRADAHDT